MSSEEVAVITCSSTRRSFRTWVSLRDFLLSSRSGADPFEATFYSRHGKMDFQRTEGLLAAVACKVTRLKLRHFSLKQGHISALCTAMVEAATSLKLQVIEFVMCGARQWFEFLAESRIPSLVQRLDITSEFVDPAFLDRAPNRRVWDLLFNTHSSEAVWRRAVEGERLRGLRLREAFPPDWIFQCLLSPHWKVESLEVDNPFEEIAQAMRIPGCNLRFLKVPGTLLEVLTCVRSITHLVVTFPGEMEISDQCRQNLCQIVGDTGCSLTSLIVQAYEYHLHRLHEPVLNELEGNYESRLEQLEMGSYSSNVVKARCSQLLKRTALFWRSSLSNEGGFVPATSAKLFMCGHSGVGKTTITTNLTQSWSKTLRHQRHPSTQGIKLAVLPFDKKKLLIYDLAGQEAYHSFHHYFIRGSDKDLFFVVCKVESKGGSFELERLLQYWLRFIVSHQSASPKRKPRVFVILNYFSKKGALGFARQVADRICQKYSSKVDLVGGCNNYPFFELDATNRSQVQELKIVLKSALEDCLRYLPRVPRTLSLLDKPVSLLGKRQVWKKKKVVHLDELCTLLEGNEDHSAKLITWEYTLTCMHHMGEAIYFGARRKARHIKALEREEDVDKYAILDLQWYLQSVIGVFIPTLERDNISGADVENSATRKQMEVRMAIEDAVGKLETLLGVEQDVLGDKISVILKLLHEMGVLIPEDTS